MSFNRTRWSRQSLAENTGAITLADASVVNGPAVFTYKSAGDALATIAAANYFSGAAFDLAVGDFIFATGSDASNMYIVAAVDRSVSPATISVNSFSTSGVVATANIQDDAVTTAKIADGAVTAAKIADLSIENADVSATAAIDFSKLATLTSTNLIVGSAANVPTSRAITGDVTIGNTGVTAIAAGVIVNADVSASAQIALSKLADLTSGEIVVGSAGNVPTAVAMAGDVTIVAAGTTAIGANKVLSSMISPLVLKYATVAVSAAEFNGAYAAPKLLLAAGGANTLIVVDRIVAVMTFVAAAYAAGGVVTVQYDSTANGAGVAATNGQAAADFFAAASTSFSFEGVSGDTVAIAPFTTSVNKGLYLSNLTQAFTTGDGTWVFHISYRVIPTV